MFDFAVVLLDLQVFPLLQEWCSARRLHVLACDLRWGVPKDSTTSTTIKICLEELDRCHQETGGQAFFLGIIGERWVYHLSHMPAPSEAIAEVNTVKPFDSDNRKSMKMVSNNNEQQVVFNHLHVGLLLQCFIHKFE